jgi:hypothetical protein
LARQTVLAGAGVTVNSAGGGVHFGGCVLYVTTGPTDDFVRADVGAVEAGALLADRLAGGEKTGGVETIGGVVGGRLTGGVVGGAVVGRGPCVGRTGAGTTPDAAAAEPCRGSATSASATAQRPVAIMAGNGFIRSARISCSCSQGCELRDVGTAGNTPGHCGFKWARVGIRGV